MQREGQAGRNWASSSEGCINNETAMHHQSRAFPPTSLLSALCAASVFLFLISPYLHCKHSVSPFLSLSLGFHHPFILPNSHFQFIPLQSTILVL